MKGHIFLSIMMNINAKKNNLFLQIIYLNVDIKLNTVKPFYRGFYCSN